MEEPNTSALPQFQGSEKNHNSQNLETGQVPGESHNAAIAESLVESTPLDDGSEDEFQARRANFRASAAHTSSSKAILERERRLGRFHLRSQQAALHETLTNLRLNDVEQKLHKLRATVLGLEDELPVQTKIIEKLPVYLHEIRRSSMDESRLNFDVVTLPTKQQPALEVLFNEKIPFPPSFGKQTGEGQTGIRTAPHIPATGDGGLADTPRNATPERLRIRSGQLLWHLQTLKGGSMYPTARSDDLNGLRVYSPLVFLRPFKHLVGHHAIIRESLQDVEARAKASRGAGTDETSQNYQVNFSGPHFDIQDLLADLRLLIDFLDVDLKPTLDLRRKINDGTAVEIEYPDLWHLFERGTYVVSQGNRDHAYMVVNLAGGREPLVDKIPYDDEETSSYTEDFIVECFSIGMNGESYVPKLEQFSIRKYYGSHPIFSLPIYPLHLAPDREELQRRFMRGGMKFFDITRKPFSHRAIRGKTLDEPSHEVDAQAIVDMTLAISAKSDWRLSEQITARDLSRRDKRETYMVSWCSHVRETEGCCGGDMIFKDLRFDDFETQSFMRKKGRLLGPFKGDILEDDHYMLMRPYVHAFVLRSRQWVTVRVEDLHGVEFKNRLDDLVLPDSHKTTVRALVTTHENSRTSHPNTSQPSISGTLDLVKGKGSGLVILLHGPPGVGKTSTAECVADDTRRPLYPITCGDIGETAAEVELNLQHNFQRAHKWGCVLLLDEADIFLAKRTKNDLRHNAVTSVFLRSLEYYGGILFLTTNRVGTIDPAFKSRIQMSLFYPKLSLDVTLSLYEKFIKRARMEQDRTQTHVFKIKEKEILKFAKRHFRELEKQRYDTWNGRQIRNAFQTAIALVEHESLNNAGEVPRPVLGRSQFETVATGFKKFDDYLIMTLGAKDSVTAKRDGLRDDTYMPGTESARTLRSPPVVMSQRAYEQHRRQSGRPGAAQSDSDEETQSDSDSDSDSDEDGLDGQHRHAQRTTTRLW